MKKAEIVIVDLYGDGEVLRLFREAPGLKTALNRWLKLDTQVGVDKEPPEPKGYLPLEQFMAKAGHRPSR